MPPQLSHFRQVPFLSSVKLPQEPHESPSKPFIRASAARLARMSRGGANSMPPNSACTPVIFEHGQIVFETGLLPAESFDVWVRCVRQLSGQPVDWQPRPNRALLHDRHAGRTVVIVPFGQSR